MRNLLLSLFTFITLLPAYSQFTFEKTYDYWDIGEFDMVYAEPDGYIMAGGVNKYDHNYLLILKTDLHGDTAWIKQYDMGFCNHGYAWISAEATDNEGNRYFGLEGVGDSANLVKIDSEWNLVWKKRLDNSQRIYKLAATGDGNILAAIRDTSYAYYILKFNKDGVIQWRSDDISYNPFGYLRFPCFTELSDSTIVLMANWINNTYYTAFPTDLYTFSSSGDSLSMLTFNTSTSYNHIVYSLPSGDEFLSLCMKPNDYIHAYLIKHKADGTILSELDLQNQNYMQNMIVKPDGTIVTCSMKPQFNHHMLVLKAFTLNGDSLWSSTIGNNNEKYMFSMKLLDDNGLLLGGYTNSIEYPEGTPYLIRTDSLGRISPVGIPEMAAATVSIYPNPASASVVFETPGIEAATLLLYDAAGRQCGTLELTSEKTSYDTGHLKQGIYFYSITANNQTIRGKLMVGAR